MKFSGWFLDKGTELPLNGPDMFKTTKLKQKFRPFHYMIRCFQTTAQFWEKCTKWPQIDLGMFKAKCIHIHAIMLRVFTHFFLEKCAEWP